MGAVPPPRALLDATAELIGAGTDLAGQLDTGLRALMGLVGADRGDAGLISPAARTYRPLHIAAGADVPTGTFEVPTTDPLVRSVMATPMATAVADVAADLPAGATRDVLVGSGTGSILVRRFEHHDDGYGLVCLDWVGRTVEVADDVVELVDYFVSRIWSPLLLRSIAEGSLRPAARSALSSLSSAERAVVELAAAGLSYREIASRRNTSVNTIGQQLRSARRKTGARNTAELCALLGP